MVRSPEYLAGPTDAPGAIPLKMTTPGLLVSQIEDLTGYRWTANGVDLLRTDAGGYRMLAGGADGYAVTETARQPNATILLVAERLAEAAAWHAVNTAVEALGDAVSPDEHPLVGRAKDAAAGAVLLAAIAALVVAAIVFLALSLIHI